jgi:hypothetical protein
MDVLTVNSVVLCSGESASLNSLFETITDSLEQPGGVDPDRRAVQMANLEQRYRISDEDFAKLSPGAKVELASSTGTARLGQVGDHPDLLRMKSVIVERHDLDVPEGWLVFGSTRPIVGHEQNYGDASMYIRGRYRAAVDPTGERAAWMIQQNRGNDASVVVTADQIEMIAMALIDNEHQTTYIDEFHGQDLFRQLSPQIQDLSDLNYGDVLRLQDRVREEKGLLFTVRDNMTKDDGISITKPISGPRFG